MRGHLIIIISVPKIKTILVHSFFNKPEDLLSIIALIISPLIYPFFIYMFLYDKLGIWMWNIDKNITC